MAALTAALLALTALNTGVQAYGANRSAKAAKKAGGIEGNLYDQQAADATARGEETANQVGAQARQLTGSQRASMAAQGLDLSSGSPADVVSDDQRRAAIAEQQIRLNAAREAFGFTQQGKLARMGAANTAAGYKNQMYGTLLSGATDLYSIYHAYGLNKAPRRPPPTSTADTGFYGEDPFGVR